MRQQRLMLLIGKRQMIVTTQTTDTMHLSCYLVMFRLHLGALIPYTPLLLTQLMSLLINQM
jgi:hypothetical protein